MPAIRGRLILSCPPRRRRLRLRGRCFGRRVRRVVLVPFYLRRLEPSQWRVGHWYMGLIGSFVAGMQKLLCWRVMVSADTIFLFERRSFSRDATQSLQCIQSRLQWWGDIRVLCVVRRFLRPWRAGYSAAVWLFLQLICRPLRGVRTIRGHELCEPEMDCRFGEMFPCGALAGEGDRNFHRSGTTTRPSGHRYNTCSSSHLHQTVGRPNRMPRLGIQSRWCGRAHAVLKRLIEMAEFKILFLLRCVGCHGKVSCPCAIMAPGFPLGFCCAPFAAV